jgi:superfamily I DNA/RNA helicase
LTNGLSDIVEFEKTMYEDDFNWGKDELSDFISNSFPVYRKQLSNEEINNIRYTIFPEIRIGKPSVIKDENGLHKLRNIIAMDLYQESLAKSIGLGPRLIRGVAGSGKTLILSSNAKHRALTNPSKKILVLCYGSVMCSKLISLIFNTGQIDNIEILTFSQYLQKYFKVYDLLNVNRLCDMIEDNFSDSPTFDFIYVEEGQDFESDWFRLLSLSLNKELNSLFIVEDKAQDIYRRKGSLKSLTGLDFRGRSRNLKINYRNTKEIASFAWEFFKNNSILSEDIILPESTIRSGKLPELFDCYSLEEEIDKIISIIKEKIEQGFSYSDISILYRSKILDKVDYIQPLTECLNLNNIPFVWLTKDKLSKKDISNLVGNNVILSTIDSAKGLDFPIIVLYESGMLPFKLEKDIQREVSLMYIALTRATQELYLTYSKDSPFLESMRKII